METSPNGCVSVFELSREVASVLQNFDATGLNADFFGSLGQKNRYEQIRLTVNIEQ